MVGSFVSVISLGARQVGLGFFGCRSCCSFMFIPKPYQG